MAAERENVVSLLAVNVKIEKSIPKYFIAEESSNCNYNISWQNQLVQAPFRRSGTLCEALDSF